MKIQLTPEQELQLEKNLVWIFASPRSGTTWLGVRLLSHNTHSMDEPYIGFHLNFQKRTFKKDHYFFADEYKETWQFFLRKLILNRIYSQYQDLTKKVIIKEPHGSLAADVISECLPNSKIIIMFRDGRDVVDSIIDATTKGGWAQKPNQPKPLSENEKLLLIQKHAKGWMKLINILIKVSKSHRKENLLVLKYEDLLKNTLDELTKIYGFLEIKIKKEKLEYLITKHSYENVPSEKKGKGKSVRFATPGKWKENFNVEEQNLVNKILGETLKQLNYPV